MSNQDLLETALQISGFVDYDGQLTDFGAEMQSFYYNELFKRLKTWLET